MKANTIQINGEDFRLDFSLMSLLVLGERWGLETLEEVISKIAELDNGSAGLSLKNLRMFDEIIQSLANSSGENTRDVKDNEVLRLPIAETMALLGSFSVMMVEAVQSKTTPSDASGKSKGPKGPKKQNP